MKELKTMNVELLNFHSYISRAIANDKSYIIGRAHSRCDRGLKRVGITWGEVRSRDKSRVIVDARRCVASLLCEVGIKHQLVAQLIKRDESMVSCYLKTTLALIEHDKRFKAFYLHFTEA